MRALAFLLALPCLLGSPAVAQEEEESVGNRLTVRTTAYCVTGTTRSGTWTRDGTVAVDPSVIPLGAHLTIEGRGGVYRAEDTGGGVRGAWVDIYMPSCAQAVNYGVQYRTVEWWLPSG